MMTFLDQRDAETGLTLTHFEVTNLGLFVCKKAGLAMLAMSPDGVMYSTWKNDAGEEIKKTSLVEYKCPVPNPIAFEKGYTAEQDDVEMERTRKLFEQLPASFDYFKQNWLQIQRRCWRRKCTHAGLYKDNWLPERLSMVERAEFGEFPKSDWVHARKKLPVPPYYNAQVRFFLE